MNTLFTINFRREAWQRELARTRRRAFALGLWVLYFGGMGVVLGLYGLNLAVLRQRVESIERQVDRMHHRPAGDAWRPEHADALVIEKHLRDPRLWRDRLDRLARVLPVNSRLRALEFNPENVSGTTDVKLVITGEIHSGPGADRVQPAMTFANQLARDSVFAHSYHNIRLVSTRALGEGEGAEFVVECR